MPFSSVLPMVCCSSWQIYHSVPLDFWNFQVNLLLLMSHTELHFLHSFNGCIPSRLSSHVAETLCTAAVSAAVFAQVMMVPASAGNLPSRFGCSNSTFQGAIAARAELTNWFYIALQGCNVALCMWITRMKLMDMQWTIWKCVHSTTCCTLESKISFTIS